VNRMRTEQLPIAEKSDRTSPAHSRRAVGISLAVVIAVGFESRLGPIRSPWAPKEVGDTLWAVMFYLLFVFMFPTLQPLRAATAALVVSFVIEFAKLWHTPWLETLRAQHFSGFLLGHGFYWHDLVCYVLGVALGLLLDLGIGRARARKATA
jgi:hypothetical protein